MKPLTVIFGANNSGKSSILQALLMLKRTAHSQNREIVLDLGSSKDVLNLGEWKDMIHGHDFANLLNIGLQWELLGEESKRVQQWIGDEEKPVRHMHYDLTAGCRPEGHVYVQKLEYNGADRVYGMEWLMLLVISRGRKRKT